ncbi:MAG: UbiA family prenyltransferase [Saprospiraceae bacterium]|nr:UbiA family prenyltransferase [Saprospiraceae bacterium]
MKHYLSLVKFSHTVFALPFALIGYFLGIAHVGVNFDVILLIKVILCMVFARSAAMAFNRWMDRDIDKDNPRTSVREIPSGILSANRVLLFVILNSLAFVGVTFFINKICFFLSPVALLIILGYSYTKRFTALCHLILGIGLALAPVGAYLAVTGEFHYLPVLFGLAVFTWVAGFDIIYSLQDDQFDKDNQLYSIPAVFGRNRALFISRMFHLLTVLFIVLAVFNTGLLLPEMQWLQWCGTVLFVLLLIYQHQLVKPNDLSRVNLAFFTVNGIGSVIFGAFFILDIFI